MLQLPQRIRNMGIPAPKKSVCLPHGPEAMSAFAIAPRPATAAVTGNCVAHSYHKFPKEPAAAAGHLAPTKTHRCRLKGKKGPSRAFPSSLRPRRLCSTSQIVLIPLLGGRPSSVFAKFLGIFGTSSPPCPHSGLIYITQFMQPP